MKHRARAVPRNAMLHAKQKIETRADLRSEKEWKEWKTENSALMREDVIASLVEYVRRTGLVDPISGHVSSEAVRIEGPNYRESLTALDTPSRGRATLYLLSTFLKERGKEIDVYAPEAVTAFADRLRSIFPRFIGSEYLPGCQQDKYPNVRHEDIQALSLPSASFDLYVSCEVLEHVPYADRALQEARRILRPGGVFMGTVPFRVDRAETLVRARMIGNAVEHVMEPEYHGNPINPDGGSLVFEVPGWDLLSRLRVAGFVDANMIFLMSANMGIVASWTGGVLCFWARA